jgi:hypothetical protein
MITASLEIVEVYDRGIPNQERILIRVNSGIRIRNHFIGIGFLKNAGEIVPINDSLLWLGAGDLTQNDIVYVYTGTGKPESGLTGTDQSKFYRMFWGRKNTAFHNPDVTPYIFEAVDLNFPISHSAAAIGAEQVKALGKE